MTFPVVSFRGQCLHVRAFFHVCFLQYFLILTFMLSLSTSFLFPSYFTSYCRWFLCQRIFAKLSSSSVPVQLGTEISLIISVTPTHPTHRSKYILILILLQEKLVPFVKLQVLGPRLGVDFTFTLDSYDNDNHNDNHNNDNDNNPHLNFFKGRVLGVKE